MKKTNKLILWIVSIITLAFAVHITAFAINVSDNEITSAAAIVIDFDTGLVIFEHNADEPRVPASMTKMIAVHVVLDAVRDGLVSLDTLIGISDRVSNFSYDRAYTNVPLPPGSSFTVRELLDAVIVRSAGAATIALGEGIFGSEEALIERMNLKVQQLGITAELYDSWGGSPNNRVSARAMAELTRALIKEHPGILEFTSQKSVYFDGIEYGSTNLLLNDYEGVDGFKTGFTNPAGWCFSATAMREGCRIITVTMGSEQGHRFLDSTVLLDYGFANYNAVIARHFRGSLLSSYMKPAVNNLLVPIMMYNIEEARYLELHDLAIILNENR